MKQAEKYRTPMEEQETNIVVDPITKRASVFSCIPSTVKALYKLLDHPDVEVEMDSMYGLMISVPQSWIKIKPPIQREFTEEQKEAMRQRLMKAREKIK